MAEPESTLPEIYLSPGEMVLAREPTILATILGSCIGITFWCARLGVGALCHSILPRCPRPPAGKCQPLGWLSLRGLLHSQPGIAV